MKGRVACAVVGVALGIAGCGGRSSLDLTNTLAELPTTRVDAAARADAWTGPKRDAGVDAGRDAPVDAGLDAVSPPDASRPHVAVLFGGIASWAYYPGDPSSGLLADTWTFDGTAWTEVHAKGPSARAGAAMAALNGKLVLFGGSAATSATSASVLADTWTFDGTTWTQLDIVGPAAREYAALAPLGGKLVLFGGATANAAATLSDTWTFDGAAWTQLAVAGPSGVGGKASMAPLGTKLVLFGGFGEGPDPTDPLSKDAAAGNQIGVSWTWTWDGLAWTELAVSSPPGRQWATMAPLGSDLILSGGANYENSGDFDDTWAWNGTSWAQQPVTGPGLRTSASMTALGETVVLFGGRTPEPPGYASDTWTYDGTAWTQVDASGPPARQAAAMATL